MNSDKSNENRYLIETSVTDWLITRASTASLTRQFLPVVGSFEMVR
jgi:hypothetical protein